MKSSFFCNFFAMRFDQTLKPIGSKENVYTHPILSCTRGVRKLNWTFVAWNFIRTIFYITKKWKDKYQYVVDKLEEKTRIWERKSFREFGVQFQVDIFFVLFCWINLLPKNIQIGEFEMQRLLLSFPKSELNLIIVFSWCSWFFGQNLPIERQWAICAFTSIANQDEFVLKKSKRILTTGAWRSDSTELWKPK